MKFMHNKIALFILITAFSLLHSASAGRWNWESFGPDKDAFCEEHMPRILEIRSTQGTEAALAAIEKTFRLAEKQFSDPYFFHSAIWHEAQVMTGNEDEAWGLAVYEYLWDRDMRKHPEYALRLPGSEYLLLDCISSSNWQLGRAAQARALLFQEEDYLTTQKGLDTDCTTYLDNGPIFSFLPAARKRIFPIREQDLPMRYRGPTEMTKEDFIYYPYIYTLTFIAGSAQASGDWIKAAELSAWGIRYADAYMEAEDFFQGEIGRVVGYGSHKRLADLALLHGYPEEAAGFLRTFIEKAESYYETGEWDILLAKLALAVIRIQLGELTEDDLDLADKAQKEIAGNQWNSRSTVLSGSLNKARVYYALGHKQKAWEMVETLFEKTASDVNPYHWVCILGTAIDLALEDGAARPELEEWLVLALENARRTGNKFEELPLYEKYARFLMIKGRYAEAVQIQQEAIRLAKAMSLPKRLQDNLDVLADMQQRIANEAVADVPDSQSIDPTPEIVETEPPTKTIRPITGGATQTIPAIDIQPRSSLSAALPGQPAYGRFYLHNPAAVAQQGTFQLTGAIDQPEWQNKQWFTISASPAFATVQLENTLNLEPGASCIIDILGSPLENGEGAGVSCQWVPTGQEQTGITGTWEYESADNSKRTAVIDAHELQENPFYLIPIHHMLQRTDTEGSAIVDYTIEASSPMRIESYDAFTGELLAVDANGDGDFLDEGDQIVGDDNRNSWPDLVFDENQHLASLVMYVKPTQAMTTDTELTVSIRVNDAWQVDSIDVIKPSTP